MGKFSFRFDQLAILCVFPIVYLIAQSTIGELRGPYWFVPNQDPDYSYLFNSLSIANLKVPGVYHHPGTTVQLLGAVVLRLSYGIQRLFNPNSPDFLDSVFIHSEQYLSILNFTVIGLTVACLITLGLTAFHFSRNLALSLLLQSTPLLMCGMIMLEPSRFASENLVLIASQLLVLVLVFYLFKEDAASSRWFPLALGITFGMGLVSKTTFIPLIFFFLLITGWRRKLVGAITSFVTFAILTIPIYPQFSRMWVWFSGIATRTGVHGGGEVGLLDTQRLGSNVSRLVFHLQPLVFFLVGLLTLVYVGLLFSFIQRFRANSNVKPSSHVRKLLWLNGITLIVFLGQIFITFRAEAIPRYLMPSVGLIGFLIFVETQLVMQAIAPSSDSSSANPIGLTSQWNNPKKFFAPVLLGLVVIIIVQQLASVNLHLRDRLELRQRELGEITKISTRAEFSQCYRLQAIRSSNQKAALFYGSNWWDDGNFSANLKRLYPDDVFYNIRGARRSPFETYDRTKVPLNKLLQNNQGCVLLQTPPLEGRHARFRPERAQLEPLFVGKSEALYRLQATGKPSPN